jgi:hypothetical protein
VRKKRIRKELAALGHEPFEPTDQLREMVKIYVWNGVDEKRIAQLLGIPYDVLVYHFAAELEYSEDQLLGFAASRMFWLASQNQDLGVALRANQHIVQARSRRWRIPKESPEDPGAGDQKRIGKMSLSEVEQELAELDKRRRAASSAPGEES